MFTLAVLNQKGGVGKTTLATNLAAAAHLDGLRTLLLDLDPQPSALKWNAARGESSKLAGLDVQHVERPLTMPLFHELAMGREFVVLDGPGKLDKLNRSAAVVADLVLLPVEPSPYDLWAQRDTLDFLDAADKLRAELGRKPVHRLFVVSAAEVGTTFTEEMPAALEGADVCGAVIHRRMAYKKTARMGEAVLTVDFDGGAAATELRALYRTIISKVRRSK